MPNFEADTASTASAEKRQPRQSRLVKASLACDRLGRFDVTLRNISVTGALVQGMREVIPGTQFMVGLSADLSVAAICRWCEADLMGLEFAEPLERDEGGQLIAMAGVFPVAEISVREHQTSQIVS